MALSSNKLVFVSIVFFLIRVAGYWVHVPLVSQTPYPKIVYSVANYRTHLSHFRANLTCLATQF